MDQRWPSSAKSYRLGVLDGSCEVYAIVDNGVFLGSELVEPLFGEEIYAPRDAEVPYEDCIRNLCQGMIDSAKGDRFELAAIVRDLLKILGIDPSTIDYD